MSRSPEDTPTDTEITALREQPRPEFLRALDARMGGALAEARAEEEQARRGRGSKRARRTFRIPNLAWAGGGLATAAATVIVAVVLVTGGSSDPTGEQPGDSSSGGIPPASRSPLPSDGAAGEAPDVTPGAPPPAGAVPSAPGDGTGGEAPLFVTEVRGRTIRFSYGAEVRGPLTVRLTRAATTLRRTVDLRRGAAGIATISVAGAPAGSYRLRASTAGPDPARLDTRVTLR